MTDIDIKEFMYSSFSNMHETIKEIKDTLKENTGKIEKMALNIESINTGHKSDIRSVKWMVGIIAFFIVSFAFFLQENIKAYNQNLINNQLQTSQKKTDNSTSYDNTVNVQ